MYGMIHTAAREMVLKDMGAEEWKNLKDRHGFNEGDFITGKIYHDERTLTLINAIANEKQVELSIILEDFGKFWIDYTAKSSFGSVYKMYGKDLFSFLENLNRMHDAIEATLSNTKTPIFECVDSSEKKIDILYSSHRKGLEAFVVGLFTGLLIYFNMDGDVNHIETKEGGALFRIRLD